MSLQTHEYDFSADALFLDFDGTLVNLAPEPDSVVPAPDLIEMLQQLQTRANGALAVVSGRPVAQLDHYLAPLRLPAAGVHGLERRDASGRLVQLAAPSTDELMERLAPFVARHPGLLLEPKRGALALHYRKAPHLEQACIEAMNYAVAHVPGFSVLRGKMVVEAKAALADKGDAIAAFMREAPFTGRRPVFVGDDVTDEAGFNWVQTLGGGLGIKIGEGESRAQMRLDNPAALHQWLEQALRVAPRV
ncbi:MULTISPECIES: trehalose-phosphatase [unclassified Herbaspirillum]|uniref:trehalose-phosphatase n=1 Tax=unclassified Herbaspirillum TaxID=2624150 RepID=UPI000E2ED2F9|nr:MULTISPECIES: trehalose-phosphatase [unclassified Herbaspirillum]RFB65571.1 trehalose-phosphatase [Herbaspirillum sp. 3R-3a1]TFI08170.1 trehalose-phosphatase [Herbaspirillum sp. 3R11]TFI14585.1 trehalose-phosphatase [Herbaspirillum sp. 3R-11]TFI24686.1 trehalose-phosphatase [Herbaspirillum sp. 3C11]